MAIVKAESWDGVTAPAIPSGWSTVAAWGTETSVFASAANGVQNTNTAVTTVAFWNTNNDGNGGDAMTSATFLFSGAGTNIACYVFCRMTTASTLQSGITSYVSQLHFAGAGGPAVFLRKLVGGTPTLLGTIGSLTLSLTDSYVLYCRTVGTTIILRVKRVSDGKWLNSSGSFVTGQQDAITVTDSSISGVGKSGISMQRGTGADFVYSDDFLFETVVTAVARRRCGATFL